MTDNIVTTPGALSQLGVNAMEECEFRLTVDYGENVGASAKELLEFLGENKILFFDNRSKLKSMSVAAIAATALSIPTIIWIAIKNPEEAKKIEEWLRKRVIEMFGANTKVKIETDDGTVDIQVHSVDDLGKALDKIAEFNRKNAELRLPQLRSESILDVDRNLINLPPNLPESK